MIKTHESRQSGTESHIAPEKSGTPTRVSGSPVSGRTGHQDGLRDVLGDHEHLRPLVAALTDVEGELLAQVGIVGDQAIAYGRLWAQQALPVLVAQIREVLELAGPAMPDDQSGPRHRCKPCFRSGCTGDHCADNCAADQCPHCTSDRRDHRYVMPVAGGTTEPCADEWHGTEQAVA